MSKQDIGFTAAILLCVVAIYLIGFAFGYMHVIVHSEAYAIEDGKCLMLEVDGHQYQYEVSPAFYKRLGY